MRIVSLAKRKGGVSASTTTVLLATALAKYERKKVLIIDTDSQRTIVDLADLDNRKGLSPIVEIKAMRPKVVQSFIQKHGENYDVIFLDLPRMADEMTDTRMVVLMYLCDCLLLPIVPSQLTVLSTLAFLKVAKDVVKRKKSALGVDTIMHGFLAMANRRAYTNETKTFFEGQGLNMFDSRIDNVKLFSSITLSDSVLESKEGRKRFEPFYKEFITKFNIV